MIRAGYGSSVYVIGTSPGPQNKAVDTSEQFPQVG
jgi:hypothetical protein